MNKKDISLLVVVIIISAILSFFMSGLLIGSPDTEPQQAEVVEAISDEFTPPSDQFFNEDSNNPTQLIRIGEDEGNVSPFGQSN